MRLLLFHSSSRGLARNVTVFASPIVGLIIIGLSLVLLSNTSYVLAGTLCVKPGGGDGCEATIGDALLLAQEGDTILVAAGPYTENVLITQTVTVQGGWSLDFSVRDLDQFTSTIKPANNTQSVVHIQGQGGDPGQIAPTLDGFLITGGRADLGDNHGGGLKITSSDALVISNTIKNNIAFLFGGGIWIQNGQPRLEGNRILENSTFGNGQEAYGGGVQLENAGASLLNNLIAHNVVSGTQAFGGGIDIVGGGILTLINNSIVSNTTVSTSNNGFGGGVSTNNVDVQLVGGVISGNQALASGGGVYFDGVSGNLTISNTFVLNNQAGTVGGGFYFNNIARPDHGSPHRDGESQAGNRALDGATGVFLIQHSTLSGNISSNGGGIFQLGGALSVTHSTISDNKADSGAGIEASFGQVKLIHSTLSGNQGEDGGGLYLGSGQTSYIHSSIMSGNSALFNAGAILNTATAALTVTQSTIVENTADDSAGAIENQGSLNLENSQVFSNSAGDEGGAILNLNNATASLFNSDVDRNTANDSGGGVWNGNNASLTVQGGSLSENKADHDNDGMGDGGGIYNKGQVLLDATTVFSNSAASFGGGIFSDHVLTIANSQVKENFSDDGAGIQTEGNDVTTILTSTISGNFTIDGGGAGINSNGLLTIRGSTFSENQTLSMNGNGGGILNNGDATIVNTTVSGNLARGFGGGIRNAGSVTLTNVTVYTNTGVLGAGGVQNMDLAVLVNTIIAANGPENCSDPLMSLGFNLEDADTCNLNQSTDLTDTDPLLGPLAFNGGTTPNHDLLTGSPAIDAGNNDACPETDQRGAARPFDGDGDGQAICDIGAIEFGVLIPRLYLPIIKKP